MSLPVPLSISAFPPIWTGRTNLVDDSIADRLTGYDHEIRALGGMWEAKISFTATVDEINEWVLNGAGRHIEIYDAGGIVFEGAVNEIDASIGSLSLKRGPLLGIANRVSNAYTTTGYNTTPPIPGHPATYGPVNNTTSQELYGIIPYIIDGGTVTATEAEQDARNYLRENAFPKLTRDISGGGGGVSLTLNVLGYIHWLKTEVYEQTASSGTQNLSAKLQAILAAEANAIFSTDYSRMATNTTAVRQYEAKQYTGWGLVKDMVNKSDSSNNRYTFGCYAGRKIRYETAPTSVEYHYAVTGEEQRVTTPSGQIVDPWRLRPGKWVLLEDAMQGSIMPVSSLREDLRTFFLESVTYSALFGFDLKEGNADEIGAAVNKELGIGV